MKGHGEQLTEGKSDKKKNLGPEALKRENREKLAA